MLDDENDKKIKEAADHYHPEYDDTAWKKMELLLDEHLPVEKERKPFLFLIPLSLFIGLFLFLFLYTSKNNKTEAPQIVISKNSSEKSVEPNSVDVLKKTPSQHSSAKNKNLAIIANATNSIEKNNRNSEEKSDRSKPASSSVTGAISAPENDLAFKQNANDEITADPNSNSTKTIQPNESDNPNLAEENKTGEEKSLPQKETASINNVANTTDVKNGKKAGKPNNGFANNFGINVSTGPDISDVYHNTIGKLTIAYGAGLSYAISKRLSVRTGFYLSKKIYSVNGNDYKMPPGSGGYYQYLQNVEANCKVYEIPLRLDYSFGKIKNHSWFVSAGLSSYLMKKETYDYYYKTPTGEIYNKDWSISNKNKHFFSVLDISGGYQYSFNPRLSLIAEPYVNLPLTGIGAGKVKLNSGGILFTIQVKPFLKKK